MGLCKLKVQIKNRPKGSVREREREKDHAVKSKKRGGKFIYGVLKGKEKLCEEDM
jgi:hypothetical protein